MSIPERRAMVERPAENLSVRRQCALLNLARSGVYRPALVTGADDLALMRRIDELHLKWPFYGSRRMVFELNQAGHGINRKRVQRLMRVMGIEGLVPRPGTSKAAPGAKIYPYLLRGVTITEPNHVWACDITYIPMASGFLYLVAVIDWASRAVLSWRLSNTMDSAFCVEALEEALGRYGKPRIFNTDQGAQFTSAAFTGKLEAAESGFRWTGGDVSWTTSSSNLCGARSSARRCNWRPVSTAEGQGGDRLLDDLLQFPTRSRR